MALNVSEDQFVLPQSSVPDALAHLSQTMWQHNIQSQRLDLAKEQKREQAGTFIERNLDPSHFGTGTVYDPVITSSLNAARQQAVTLAQQGADIPTIMQAIGPSMNKINSYYSAAKTVSKQVDDTIKAMRDNKMDEGYKMADVRSGALKSAFMTKDKDGNDVLADPDNVNLSTNYVQKAITDNPGAYTTDEALTNFAKQSPKSTRQQSITTMDSKGNSTKKNVEVTAANWEVPEDDGKGNISLVPAYDHATDNGQLITHKGPDGQDQPIRLFDEGQFDRMMKSKPGLADYVKGQVQQHLQDYKDANGKEIDINSPQAKLVGRAIAYQELQGNGNSTVRQVQENKVAPQQITLNLEGTQQQQAYNKEMGVEQAKNDASAQGIAPQKENTVSALGKVFNNDPAYMNGPLTKKGGIPVVDITSKLPKAQLLFGHGEKDAYSGVYYDPAGRQLILDKKDGTTEKVPEAQIGQFFGRVAEANGVPVGAIKPLMNAAGWSNGKFGSPGAAPDIATRANQEAAAAHQTKAKGGLDVIDTDADAASKHLRGLDVPGGKVAAVNVRKAWQTTFGADKYSVDVKGADGKVTTQTFKDKNALQGFLNKGAVTAPVTSPSGVQWK